MRRKSDFDSEYFASTMPSYEVLHAVPLSDTQQDQLAQAITEAHTSIFSLPRLFVNVAYIDISNRNTYVGGKRQKVNHINARVRLGARTEKEFQKLCDELANAWDRIVIGPARERKENFQNLRLQTIILSPGNPTGREAGFNLPRAGEEGTWIKENYAGFQERAQRGEENFVDLLHEIEERHLV